MSASVFPVLSLDRSLVRWEDHIEKLTPVEERQGVLWKRDDYFAPLGYGGINGAKVRQILWLVGRYLQALPPGASPGLMLAGSVMSPQLGRVAAVAKHFGIPAALIIGSALSTAIRNENVLCGANLGAEFHRAKVAYNPALQAKARELHKESRFSNYYLMEYGLSVEGSEARIESFYRFCSEQSRTIPDDVETLIVPAGSCNTTIAVLYGIARFRPKSLRRVILFGIGPTRIDWYEDRLVRLKAQSGVDIGGLFVREYIHHPELARKYAGVGGEIRLQHFDLHASKFAAYADEMPATFDGIRLHPNYEGKILTYIQRNPDLFRGVMTTQRTMFWIVGSAPSWGAMEANARPYLSKEGV